MIVYEVLKAAFVRAEVCQPTPSLICVRSLR
jgi:hypothetical protein